MNTKVSCRNCIDVDYRILCSKCFLGNQFQPKSQDNDEPTLYDHIDIQGDNHES